MRYWAVQIGVSAFFAIALPVVGVILIALKPDEGGMGLIVFLIGVAFWITMIVLLNKYFSMSTQQRAIYGWVVNQQRGQTVGHTTLSGAASSGRVAMGIAQRAAAGQISRSELIALQKLRPEIPYPGDLPADI